MAPFRAMDPSSRPRRASSQVASIVVPALIVLAATAAVAWVAIFARPGAPQPSSAEVVVASSASPAPQQTVEDESPPPPPAGRCERATLAAPASGRWVLQRAEFGSRGRHDYLRLRLSRDGSADAAASMTAEIVPALEVDARHGQSVPPGADNALVVRFDGPVRAPGAFGGRGSGALGAFRISGGAGEATYVVAAIHGEGCFEVGGGAWASGEPSEQVEITLLIERG